MNRNSPRDERKGDATGTDAQLKSRSVSGEFSEEIDGGVEDVGSKHVLQRLVVLPGDSFAEVIVWHDRTVVLGVLNWFGRTAPTGGVRGSACQPFLQIRKFLAVPSHEPVGQQRYVFALYIRRQGKETH